MIVRRSECGLRCASLIALAVLVASWPAQAADVSAARVIRDSGVSAGLAVVVGAADGTLEAGLTNDGKMLVHGLALSDVAATRARKHIFGRKLYGLASVSVVKTATTLPYYDRIVNLLVADLDALGKDAPPAEEVQRVLGYEGVAYLKRGGRWTKTVKPTPEEIDSWSHYHHDASQNPVSKDLTVGPPNTFRWSGGPFGTNKIGGFRTSDGVAVQINLAYLLTRELLDGRPEVPPDLDGLQIWARDVNSGVLLWHRPILPREVGTRYAVRYSETFVAAGGRVYAYDFTNKHQIALTSWNLRTGAVECVYDQSTVCRKADTPDLPPDRRGRKPDWRVWADDTFARSVVLATDGKVVQMVQDRIFVMDAASGRVLWKKQTGDTTQYLKVFVSDGRLGALVARVGPDERPGTRRADLVAAEAWRWEDGSPLWRTDLKGLAYLTGVHEDLWHPNFATKGPYLMLPHEKGVRLMSAKDGSLIWDKPIGGRMKNGFFMIKDRLWMGHVGTDVFGGVVMLATGERDPTPRSGGTNQSACDAPTATVNWFMGKRNFIPVEPRPEWPDWVSLRCIGKKCGERAACSYGSIYAISPKCGCDQFIRGSNAWYAVKPVTPLADSRRLAREQGGALGPLGPQVNVREAPPAVFWDRPEGIANFWFTSNFRWSTPMLHWSGYGLTHTEPVRAGDLTLVAHVHEHRLAASRGGKEVWNVVAGGRISAPPVVHGGLAIFASHDGYVYAVKVRDGSPAWRFLAAPADRRHVMLGQVESAWPVFNVVPDGEKIYCSAGRHEELDGGIHFYCLDAASGALKWHVSRRRGMESSLAPYRERKNTGDDKGIERIKKGILSDGRARINDRLELREGRLWLNGVPTVDVAAPRDDVTYAKTLVPPQLVE